MLVCIIISLILSALALISVVIGFISVLGTIEDTQHRLGISKEGDEKIIFYREDGSAFAITVSEAMAAIDEWRKTHKYCDWKKK